MSSDARPAGGEILTRKGYCERINDAWRGQGMSAATHDVLLHHDAALRARADAAERERDEAKNQLLAVKEFHFSNGDFDAAFVGEGAAAIAMTLIGFYRAQGGTNYVEMQLSDKKTAELFTVTVQRAAGRTPHQLRDAAEARADRLERENAELRGLPDARA